MAFCGKSGVLWSVKAGMTKTYYLFLCQCRLILPEMWGRVWGGERAVRISRNNFAHVKKQTGQNMLWIMFCPVLLCFRFSYLPYRLQMPVRCCAVRAVCMDMHSEVECVFARSNLLFGAVGQHYGGV